MVSLGLTWSHLVSVGLTWSLLDSLAHLVSLGFTWTHLVSLGPTWTHLVSLGLSWTHLKPCVLLRFERPAGPTAPVNNTTKEKGQMAENRIKSHPGRIRTHQNVYRRHQGGPTISQKHFSNHFVNIHLHRPQGHAAREEEDYSHSRPQPQDHAPRSH